MKKLIISFIITIFIITVICLYSILTFPTASPLAVIAFFFQSKSHPHATMKQQVLAFLPYWRIADTRYTRFDLLSEINYFSLSVDVNGNFVKVVNDQTNPGWLAWDNQTVKDMIAKAQIAGDRFSLTIAMQQDSLIEQFLNNSSAQKTLITNIIDQITTRHLNGIIIDFEYTGTPDDQYQKAFTDFSKNLRKAMQQQTPDATLSLTLMPLAVREKGLFDLPHLNRLYDHFIGMSYDYYGANSTIAGPVAPMTGFKENKYYFDVTTTYQDYETVIPKNKLFMGVPYYGWDWSVTDGKKIQSPVLPINDPNNYAAVISYARAREDRDIKPKQCQWDDYAKSTWCWYTDSKGINHQVWLEDNTSIGIKFDFAQQNNFEGIAIWTLGYDKQYADLWSILEKDFTQK